MSNYKSKIDQSFVIFSEYLNLFLVKFIFSKKATKIDQIFTVKSTVKTFSIFVAFLENMNFKCDFVKTFI